MKISSQWLKDYLKIDLSPTEISEILTSTGLEVSEISDFQSIKGGLNGLVIGEVISCVKHPDADKLSLTTVDIGGESPLSIVCGAPNVAAGQKVIVATIGTILYSDEGSFTIKKSKIRGQLSEGMICAEDEIGLGSSHDGILVLPHTVENGTPAAQYFGIETDTILEVDLTANRVDAASHIGVARDLAAALSAKGEEVELNYPSVSAFPINLEKTKIKISIENTEACIRYAGLSITDLKIKESPEWLKNRLKAIGLKPINNVVDATNFILHECSQPLHAFDASHVGEKLIVKTTKGTSQFKTLDGEERLLNEKDLMICNEQEPMCIAGILGGLNSGVHNETTSIFLESACFHPVWIRKTARRHGLNTDASFRFERGVDANNVMYALKRAALLIQELAGGTLSEPIDIYPNPVNPIELKLTWGHVNRLVGKVIPESTIRTILHGLEINVLSEDSTGVFIQIPSYRVDVTREVDVIEDILRIYGYNNVEIPSVVKSTLSYVSKPDPHQTKNTIADLLSSTGFNEIMCNSLTKESYYNNLETYPISQSVRILNPLSSDLNVLRQTLLFGGLESLAYNQNRKLSDLKLYEFGNCYSHNSNKKNPDQVLSSYQEEERLALWISGKKTASSWTQEQQKSSFFELKSYVSNLLNRIGVSLDKFTPTSVSNTAIFKEALVYTNQNEIIVSIGAIRSELLKNMDINNEVYYADISWSKVFNLSKQYKLSYQEIAKFPEVKRDLSILIDQNVSFENLERAAYKAESKLLKKVDLFDVYEGKNLPEGKKSYALSFILQDQHNTLIDKQIEKVMKKIIMQFEQDYGAQLR